MDFPDVNNNVPIMLTFIIIVLSKSLVVIIENKLLLKTKLYYK